MHFDVKWQQQTRHVSAATASCWALLRVDSELHVNVHACVVSHCMDETSSDYLNLSAQYHVHHVCLPSGYTIPPLELIRKLNYSDPTQNGDKFILEDSGYVARRYAVPLIFRQMLDVSTIPSSRQYYWWRAQVRRRFGVSTV